MDNLTHTLAGALIGETFSRFGAADDSALSGPQRHSIFVGLSVLCSNLPDADVLYTFAAGSKLDYLIQHRGYTHTIVGVLVAAALVMAAVELWMRWRGLSPTRADRKTIGSAVGVSLLLHLAMDYTNSYGVHPFWPLDNRWIYGDAVFIIEPLLWTCAAPLFFLWRTVAARLLIAAVLAACVALAFGTHWLVPASGIGLSILMLLLLWAGWKASGRIALICALGAWLAVTATFFATSAIAARQVASEFAHALPNARLIDHVLTPLPANPLCWDVIAIAFEGDQYVLRRAVLSTAPDVISAQSCPDQSLGSGTTAPMRRVAGASSAAVRWVDEYRTGRTDFARVLRTYCEAERFMHFARAPWIANPGQRWIIGDLRYDREPELGFAELELANPSTACSKPAAPWAAPRADLAAPAP